MDVDGVITSFCENCTLSHPQVGNKLKNGTRTSPLVGERLLQKVDTTPSCSPENEYFRHKRAVAYPVLTENSLPYTFHF
ncbi:hypothetical protein Krac_1667 [Ktedonobacter racemifer DSM 44963]|uniref:Uncharacterized protein n=1 Tax=Ktedonobacter racemifer DSM 44963 TaxID=485913 RepID=D6U2P5_KTERA|nr:hypothetical protein Krac_1667 [Ktedonobacter racemifer DSM 44963]